MGAVPTVEHVHVLVVGSLQVPEHHFAKIHADIYTLLMLVMDHGHNGIVPGDTGTMPSWSSLFLAHLLGNMQGELTVNFERGNLLFIHGDDQNRYKFRWCCCEHCWAGGCVSNAIMLASHTGNTVPAAMKPKYHIKVKL